MFETNGPQVVHVQFCLSDSKNALKRFVKLVDLSPSFVKNIRQGWK
jgi:hypothetical protein